jgi:putative oxidoreductase
MPIENSTSYAALILRLALGIMLIAHGFLKIFVFTMPGTVGFFESIGYPGFLAYVVTLVEVGGGLMLIAGLYVRPVSIVIIPVLLGAAQVHFGNGWLFSAEGGGWEYPVFLAVAAVVQALLGEGQYAVRLPIPGQIRNDA